MKAFEDYPHVSDALCLSQFMMPGFFFSSVGNSKLAQTLLPLVGCSQWSQCGCAKNIFSVQAHLGDSSLRINKHKHPQISTGGWL